MKGKPRGIADQLAPDQPGMATQDGCDPRTALPSHVEAGELPSDRTQSSPKRSSVCSSLIFVLWIAWFAGLVVAEAAR